MRSPACPSTRKSRSANVCLACALKHARPPSANTFKAQVANNPNWKKTARTEPKCIFIDLGAADGNTFAKFLESLAKEGRKRV